MNGESQGMTQMQGQAAPVAPVAPQPVAAPAPVSAPSVNDEFAELRRLSLAGAERMGRAIVTDNPQGVEGGAETTAEPQMTLPAGLVNNAFATQATIQAAAQAAQAANQTPAQPAQPTQQPDGTQQQATTQAPAQPNAEQPSQAEQQAIAQTKITLRNAQGQEMAFENDQLVNMLNGFHHYESQIANIQNDYNQKYQALEADRQKTQADQARIDSLMKSEKGFILEALEKNPAFAERVSSLIAEQPDLLTGYQNRKIDAVAGQGNDRIAQLEQQLKTVMDQIQQSQQQSQQSAEQTRLANEQASRDQAIQAIQTNVAQLNAQYQLPKRTVDALTAQAVLEVQSGRLPFDVRAVTGWFDNQLKAIATDFNNIRDQVRGEYLTEKRQAPPPPPTGGGIPSPANTSEMTPHERVRLIANQLSQATNGNLR